MKDTPQEYIKRITSYVEGEQPMKVQAATPKKLERLIRGVSLSKLRKRPAPDKWSPLKRLATRWNRRISPGVVFMLGCDGHRHADRLSKSSRISPTQKSLAAFVSG